MLGYCRVIRKFRVCAMVLACLALPGLGHAQSLETTTLNNFGVPSGLVELPTAEMAPDGQLGVTVSHFKHYGLHDYTGVKPMYSLRSQLTFELAAQVCLRHSGRMYWSSCFSKV